MIGNTKRVATHANTDDSVMHWTLKLKECEGNIIRLRLINKKKDY